MTEPAVPESPEQPVSRTSRFFSYCLVAIFLLLLSSVLRPTTCYFRKQGKLTACKSNLKNTGTAMEMYATDFDGRYPCNLSLLTPIYLKAPLICPSSQDTQTYRLTLGVKTPVDSTDSLQHYFIECTGENHTDAGIPADYPQFDSVQGLIER